MKIKTKKEITLPQLIEWAWGNDIEDKVFTGGFSAKIRFFAEGRLDIPIAVDPGETFAVEIEEEITEETVIPMVLEVCRFPSGSIDAGLRRECSIKEALDDNEIVGITTHALYMLNDDASLTLIWKSGEMME
ncbi:hypothetical protein [Staphylococcus coagulans]|uniref:hypothetical protein n=1 Tax=Staphylococcus coagulans TaxID=74706 RepID=UPI0015FBC693|nr:hypothetical protein [Staphylococcus coagulans]MBA8761732.1 hypothetical protein [Staphylococcus coagulans]